MVEKRDDTSKSAGLTVGKPDSLVLLDVVKYGFKLFKKSESGIIFYRRTFGDLIVELMVAADVYSLSALRKGHREMVVANRYRVSTQSELDFLIYNGRVGDIFIG
jgi:hypothetical protein